MSARKFKTFVLCISSHCWITSIFPNHWHLSPIFRNYSSTKQKLLTEQAYRRTTWGRASARMIMGFTKYVRIDFCKTIYISFNRFKSD